MRLFGSERLMKVFTSLGVAENEQIEHKMLSNAIEKAQEKIEFNNFGIRKNLLDYDQVNNEQREIIYKERRQVLDGDVYKRQVHSCCGIISDPDNYIYPDCRSFGKEDGINGRRCYFKCKKYQQKLWGSSGAEGNRF